MAGPPTSVVSPIIGSGLTPGGSLGAQLAAVTRRAVIPNLYVQIYQSHPLLSLLWANAKAVKGGVSQITIPVQGASFTTFSWGGFGGDFPMPTDQAAMQNAQFDIKLGMVPVGFFGMEALIQSSEVIIPKLRVVMADTATVMKQAFAQALYQNTVGDLAWHSLANAYDDGTNYGSYGGIPRNGNQFWQGQYIPGAGTIPTSRVGMAQLLTRIQSGAGGEAPDFAVMNPANWAQLMTDFMSLEMFTTRPRSIYAKDDAVNAGFRAIKVLDTPIFPDPFCPLGSAFFINSRYLGLHLHEQAPMTFSGFESMIPQGQIAEIGVLISAGDVVCAKPSSGSFVAGISGAAWPNLPNTSPAVV
jgi:hypothetical protein